MKLLISTPLQIFLFDPLTREFSVIRAGDGYYYGITFKNDIIALSHSGGYLQIFESGRKTIQTVHHVIQPHQLEWVDDSILAANTGKNCISEYDTRGNLIRDVYLNEIRWDDKDAGRKGNHFNTVHLSRGKIYVVAHNYERSSEVFELSWPELEVLETHTTKAGWAHNYWECEWGRIICDSKNGGLYDLNTGETIWKADEQPTMTRGLAATDDFIFVGYSTFNPRTTRYWKTGGLWIIDRKTLQTVDKILMPGSGDVHEIRLVGVPDTSHNQQTLSLEAVKNIRRVSPTVRLAYQLRKKYPRLRDEVFPVSQIVRSAQMTARWCKGIYI
ncbi:MAG: hypothetical protein H6636_09265 [Anaerolineales bacterium]|nr:hypothetical protein [Anaerolineales bacterium]